MEQLLLLLFFVLICPLALKQRRFSNCCCLGIFDSLTVQEPGVIFEVFLYLVVCNPLGSVPHTLPCYVHCCAENDPKSAQIDSVCLFSLRYSHGEVVQVSELRDFLEADLANMQQGSSCLAKHEDGIWYPAKITGTTTHLSCQKFSTVSKGHTIKKKKKDPSTLFGEVNMPTHFTQ